MLTPGCAVWHSNLEDNRVVLPFLAAYDPLGGKSGSIDPLGALQSYGSLADLLLPGVTTITTRSRYLGGKIRVEGGIDPEHVATEHRRREALGIGTDDEDIGDESEDTGVVDLPADMIERLRVDLSARSDAVLLRVHDSVGDTKDSLQPPISEVAVGRQVELQFRRVARELGDQEVAGD
jgi:hypothetical protein